MAVGLCSLGLAGLGVGLCKRNNIINVALALNRPITTTAVKLYKSTADACERNLELSFPGISLPGTFAPWNFRFPGPNKSHPLNRKAYTDIDLCLTA